MVLLERHMVGAGLTVPARGPTAKWYMKWVTTGVCTLENDWPRQQVLGPRPRLHVNRGIDAWHRPPRPDVAPPTHPPANTIKVYVTVSTHQRTWAAVGVTGGAMVSTTPEQPLPLKQPPPATPPTKVERRRLY